MKFFFLHLSLILSLIFPLTAMAIIASTYFFKGSFNKWEKLTYKAVKFFYSLNLFFAFCAFLFWLVLDEPHYSISLLKLPISQQFSIDFVMFYDGYGIVFLLTSAIIVFIITFFSHRYLHRDPSYRRFFIVISLFVFGMNLVILAGNFDLIFMGWEILGLSSYLLIGYFFHRPKAIAAANRAYFIYRICDLGFLFSLLISHFFWHNINFNDFLHYHLSHSLMWLLSICLLIPVVGKSALFPFCFWLPKAMEGPTQSSAIFYGSLSIHVGIFLLIRTEPLWAQTAGFNYVLLAIGIITALSCSLFALVQSNIKGQIGYASIAQVGLMLVELSFGFILLTFIHMIGNAFLRCFQLLISPSILTTHLHMQNVVRTFNRYNHFSLLNLLPKRLWPSAYIFAMNEGFFEVLLKKIFVNPTMYLAKKLNHFLVLGFFLSFILIFFFNLKLFFLLLSLLFSLSSLAERKSAKKTLILAILGNLSVFLSITGSRPSLLYLIGLLTSSLIALELLFYIEKRRSIPDLKQYYGLFEQFPLAGAIFLLGALGIVSFPLSSTFYGEDVLLNLTLNFGLHYLFVFQLIFVINGIAIIRLYSLIMFAKRGNVMPDIKLDLSASQAFLRISFFFIGNMLAFFIAK